MNNFDKLPAHIRPVIVPIVAEAEQRGYQRGLMDGKASGQAELLAGIRAIQCVVNPQQVVVPPPLPVNLSQPLPKLVEPEQATDGDEFDLSELVPSSGMDPQLWKQLVMVAVREALGAQGEDPQPVLDYLEELLSDPAELRKWMKGRGDAAELAWRLAGPNEYKGKGTKAVWVGDGQRKPLYGDAAIRALERQNAYGGDVDEEEVKKAQGELGATDEAKSIAKGRAVEKAYAALMDESKAKFTADDAAVIDKLAPSLSYKQLAAVRKKLIASLTGEKGVGVGREVRLQKIKEGIAKLTGAAIEAVQSGQAGVSATGEPPAAKPKAAPQTDAEKRRANHMRDLPKLLGGGFTKPEISRLLGVTPETVDEYIAEHKAKKAKKSSPTPASAPQPAVEPVAPSEPAPVADADALPETPDEPTTEGVGGDQPAEVEQEVVETTEGEVAATVPSNDGIAADTETDAPQTPAQKQQATPAPAPVAEPPKGASSGRPWTRPTATVQKQSVGSEVGGQAVPDATVDELSGQIDYAKQSGDWQSIADMVAPHPEAGKPGGYVPRATLLAIIERDFGPQAKKDAVKLGGPQKVAQRLVELHQSAGGGKPTTPAPQASVPNAAASANATVAEQPEPEPATGANGEDAPHPTAEPATQPAAPDTDPEPDPSASETPAETPGPRPLTPDESRRMTKAVDDALAAATRKASPRRLTTADRDRIRTDTMAKFRAGLEKPATPPAPAKPTPAEQEQSEKAAPASDPKPADAVRGNDVSDDAVFGRFDVLDGLAADHLAAKYGGRGKAAAEKALKASAKQIEADAAAADMDADDYRESLKRLAGRPDAVTVNDFEADPQAAERDRKKALVDQAAAVADEPEPDAELDQDEPVDMASEPAADPNDTYVRDSLLRSAGIDTRQLRGMSGKDRRARVAELAAAAAKMPPVQMEQVAEDNFMTVDELKASLARLANPSAEPERKGASGTQRQGLAAGAGVKTDAAVDVIGDLPADPKKRAASIKRLLKTLNGQIRGNITDAKKAALQARIDALTAEQKRLAEGTPAPQPAPKKGKEPTKKKAEPTTPSNDGETDAEPATATGAVAFPSQAKPDVTPEQQRVLSKYKGASFDSLNKYLRAKASGQSDDDYASGLGGGGADPKQAGLHVQDMQKMEATLRSVFDGLKPFDEPVTVYRGRPMRDAARLGQHIAELEKAARTGEPITLPGYTSTSADPQVASDFARDGKGVQYVIAAKGGMDMSSLFPDSTEAELLLDNNSQFKVGKVEKLPNGGYRVQMEQVGPKKPQPAPKKGKAPAKKATTQTVAPSNDGKTTTQPKSTTEMTDAELEAELKRRKAARAPAKKKGPAALPEKFHPLRDDLRAMGERATKDASALSDADVAAAMSRIDGAGLTDAEVRQLAFDVTGVREKSRRQSMLAIRGKLTAAKRGLEGTRI